MKSFFSWQYQVLKKASTSKSDCVLSADPPRSLVDVADTNVSGEHAASFSSIDWRTAEFLD
jgi:hypothetical protein